MNHVSTGTLFTKLEPEEQGWFLSGLTESHQQALLHRWPIWARQEQIAPPGSWSTWVIMAGRGFGKTRAGAEWVRSIAEEDGKARFALIGANFVETRTIMVEGESGLLSIAPPDLRPEWEPSLKRLRWKNGAEARLYSAAEPEGLRGPQHSHAWCDEVAKWMNNDSAGDGGRSVSDLDAIAGVTRLMLFDLPFAPDTPNHAAKSAQLFAVAAGQEGWRSADLYRVMDNGSVGEFVSKISFPGILGTVEQVFAASSGFLIDQHTNATVKLQHSVMVLNDADEAQLSAGQNIAFIGQEIVQFASAKPLGNGRYLLSRFYRGLGGTERFIENHISQENFILFDTRSATLLSSNHYTLFQPSQFAALGRDDRVPATAEIVFPGSALMPWHPVHLKHSYTSSTDLDVVWTRRSRAGSVWADYVDVPLAEEVEEYVIRWESSSGELLGEALVDTPSFRLLNQQISSYRNQNISEIQFSVRQRGQHTLSAPAFLNAPI